MIFFSLLGCIIIFYRYRTPVNILVDPFTVLFVALLYYGFLIPICMVLFNDYLLPFQSYGLIVSDHDVNMVAILLLCGYAAFVAGYRLVIPRNWIDDLVHASGGIGKGQAKIAQKFLGVVSTGFFVVLILFFWDTLISVLSGYESKIEIRYDDSAYSLIYKLWSMVFLAYAVTKVFYGRTYVAFSIIITILLLILSLITFSKDPMVYCAIFLLSVGARAFNLNQAPVFLAAIGAAALVLMFVVPAFSAYRSTGVLMFSNPSGLPMAYLFSDASGPFSSIILAIRNQASVNMGPLYEAFALWIPRSIWPDRPLDAAEAYAQAVMLDWRPGFGLGFSPFAEANIRYGIVFAPFLFLLAGLFMAVVQLIVSKRLPIQMMLGLVFVVQSYTLFTAFRGPFSGLVTAMAQFWIPFLAIVLVFGYARNSSGWSIGPVENVPR